MELIDVKCPNCGAPLKVNAEMKIGECFYCHSQFIVKDAIHKFKGEIDGIATNKTLMTRARQLLDSNDIDSAMKILKNLLNAQPNNAEVYYLLFLCEKCTAQYYRRLNSQMISVKYNYINDLNNAIESYGKYAVEFARDDEEEAFYRSEVNDVVDEIEKIKEEIRRNNKKEGCYIATAVYGSYEASEVITLRRFRDNVLQKHMLGRLFIKFYYLVSPPLAKKLKNWKWLNHRVKKRLDKFVGILHHNYDD